MFICLYLFISIFYYYKNIIYLKYKDFTGFRWKFQFLGQIVL